MNWGLKFLKYQRWNAWNPIGGIHPCLFTDAHYKQKLPIRGFGAVYTGVGGSGRFSHVNIGGFPGIRFLSASGIFAGFYRGVALYLRHYKFHTSVDSTADRIAIGPERGIYASTPLPQSTLNPKGHDSSPRLRSYPCFADRTVLFLAGFKRRVLNAVPRVGVTGVTPLHITFLTIHGGGAFD